MDMTYLLGKDLPARYDVRAGIDLVSIMGALSLGDLTCVKHS
ncbi:hypothetical protein [Pseudomonas sp. H2_D02]